MPDLAVAKLSDLLDETASDSTSDPVERLASLRSLRADLSTLVGQADTYIADQQSMREGAAMDRIHDHVGARENAKARGLMIVNRQSTPEQLTAAGLLDDDELDKRVADGTIEETVLGVGSWERAAELDARIAEAVTPTSGDRLETEPGLSQPSTADVFSRTNGKGKRVYSASRKPVHRAVIDMLLGGHETQEKPQVMFVGGDPAGVKPPDDAVSIDVAAIRKALPEYNKMKGDPEQDAATHGEALDIAGQVEREARGKKLNVVMMGLQSHQAKDMVSRVTQFQKAGYGQAQASYGGDDDLAEAMAPLGLSLQEVWSDAARAAALLSRDEHKKLRALAPGEKVPDTIRPGDKPDKPFETLKGNGPSLDDIERMGLNKWPEKDEAATKVLGDAKDTQELWRAKGAASSDNEGGAIYQMARKPKHDQMVGGVLGDAVGELLGKDHPIAKKLKGGGVLNEDEKQTVRDAADKDRGGANPVALFMAGGSASGKSSALKVEPDLVPHAAASIDPDALKEMMPEYSKLGRYAAAGTHEESSDVAKRVLSEAQDLKLNMVVDGTGDSKPGKFVGKITKAHDAGYDTRALYVTIPTDMAVQRSVKRAGEKGRFVPIPEVRSQHKNVSANFLDVAKLPFLKDLKVYDNRKSKTLPNGKVVSDPELIGHGSGGNFADDNAALMKEMIAKKDEKAEA